MGKKIYISPSTQEWNQYYGGGTGTGDSEEYWMRKIAFPLADLLRSAGHIVRVGGTASWKANVEDSNAWGSLYHYAIHTNAGGGQGTEVWYYDGSTTGEDMAKRLFPFVAAESNKPDRGIKKSRSYGELNNTKMGAVIVEILFHDNAEEAQELRNDWQKFVVALAKGILAKAGGSLPATPPAPPVVVTPPVVEIPPVDPCLAVKQELAGVKFQLAKAETDRNVLSEKIVKAKAALS